jgi:RND family efflux transporter MFP subunit
MRKFLKYTMPLALLALAIVAFIVLMSIGKARKPERRADTQQAILVDSIAAQSRAVDLVVKSLGTVRPRTETTLVSEVSGKIVSVSPKFIAGGFFQQGEVLLQIDPSDYETALKRTEAALASRRAALADARARSEQALKDWDSLGRQGEPSDLVLRKPQLADAQANVQAAEADVDKARRDLQRTSIQVPYAGLVREKRVDIGQYVSPGNPLGVTFAVDTAEIRLPLSSGDLEFLDLPTATEAASAQYPEVTLLSDEGGVTHRWQARIIRTEGVLDVDSRVLNTVAQVIDPYGVLGESEQDELRMGTFVRAEIKGHHLDRAVVLPRHVLRRDNTVLVANAERKLEIRAVTVARADAQSVYITQGIEDGEQIVITTLDAPIPGTQLALSSERGSQGGEQAGDESGSADDATP